MGTQRQGTAVSTQRDPVGTQRQVLSAPASDNLYELGEYSAANVKATTSMSVVGTQRHRQTRLRL